MGGIAGMEEARALVADTALWPLVRDFLWDFAPQIHPSWLEEIPGAGAIANNLALSSSPRVKKWILSSLGVEPCFHLFPKDDWSRLLLLDGAKLLEIAKWLGAISFVDPLRRITAPAQVKDFKAAFAGVYPDIFAYAMYFTPAPSKKGAASAAPASDLSPAEVAAFGVSQLWSFVAKLDKPLLRRLELKLPKSATLPDSGREMKRDASRESKNLRLLLKLRFPEAFSLCC